MATDLAYNERMMMMMVISAYRGGGGEGLHCLIVTHAAVGCAAAAAD